MSTCAKQVTPNRCYCRVQDEEVNLSEIAKLITALNVKVLGLRNEIGDLKNISINGEKKLFMKSDSVCRYASSRHCERATDTSRCNVKFDKSIVSEKSKVLADFFENNSTNKIWYDKTNKGISNHATNANHVFSNERLQAIYYAPVFEYELKKGKNISKGIQCDAFSTMERKRKRKFLSCFKTESYIKEHDFFKSNKKMNISPKSNDPCIKEGKLTEKNHNSHNKLLKSEIYKLHENNISKNDPAQCGMELSKDVEERDQHFKFSINRMGGGAETRGNRLISDFYDKMQKINLYKNVKFDARNVKKRLDACIVELNEIIEDASLIFPNVDKSKEF